MEARRGVDGEKIYREESAMCENKENAARGKVEKKRLKNQTERQNFWLQWRLKCGIL